MKRSRLLEIIKEVMSEEGNVTGAVGGYAVSGSHAVQQRAVAQEIPVESRI